MDKVKQAGEGPRLNQILPPRLRQKQKDMNYLPKTYSLPSDPSPVTQIWRSVGMVLDSTASSSDDGARDLFDASG